MLTYPCTSLNLDKQFYSFIATIIWNLEDKNMSLEQKKIDHYLSTIKRAKGNPYDANDESEMPVPLTPERMAAYSVLAELNSRSGFNHVLINTEIEDREELVETLAAIIKIAMTSE